MNNPRLILILGAGRTGKTTLCRMLRQDLPEYNLIHSDALRISIMTKLPANFRSQILSYEENTYYSDLLLGFIEEQYYQDGSKQGIILDGGYLLPGTLKDSPLYPNMIIYYLGYSHTNAQEILHDIRTHDTPADWSSTLTDAELLEKINYFIELNSRYRHAAKEYDLPYMETSIHRNEVLTNVRQTILSAIQSP